MIESMQPQYAFDERCMAYPSSEATTACTERSPASSATSRTASPGLPSGSGFQEDTRGSGALEVPLCFTRRALPLRGCTSMPLPSSGGGCGSGSMLASKQSEAEREEHQILFQQVLHSFTRSMHAGVEMQVLLDDGNAVPVEVSLSHDCSRFILRVRDVCRDISLDDIEQICNHEEALEAGTTNAQFLNECCVTLVMDSEQFLTFTFDNARLREYFEACMKSFMAARIAPTTTL